MRILLIDDNQRDMKHFCDELEFEGHKIIQAYNLDDVKKIIDKKEKFDGIILDLMFPPNNGIPIKESEYGYLGGKYIYDNYLQYQYSETPFIILTAMDSSTKMYQDVDQNFKSSFRSYRGIFLKPVEIEEIINALQSKKQ